MTQLLPNIFCYPVPEGSYDHRVVNPTVGGNLPRIDFNYMPEGYYGNIKLPPGSYTFICLRSTATEEQARMIVPRYDGDAAWVPSYNDPDSGGSGYCYEDYSNEDEHSVFYTALASLSSLLLAKGIEGEVAIIKLNV